MDMQEELFSVFALAAFIKLLIFAVVEMRMMLLVWKARRAEAFAEGWQAVRRELGVLYSRFCQFLLFASLGLRPHSLLP